LRRGAVHGFPAGTVLGVPLFIDATAIYLGPWVAIIALTQSSGRDLASTLIFFAVIIASLLAHELAHAYAAKALGVPVRHVALTWFGGYAAFWVEPTRWRDATIAFAGPAANLAIGAALFAATAHLPDPNVLELVASDRPGAIALARPRELTVIEQTMRDGAFVNLALGVFNLLPGMPLDGGHVLRAALSTRMSLGRASWIAAWAGIVIGALATAYGAWIESFTFFFLGLFVGLSAWGERRALRYG
jgi:Zn-dependent protease